MIIRSMILILLVGISPNNELIQTGKRLQVRSLMTGRQHYILQRAAEEHAAHQAFIGIQGHQYWGTRVMLLQAQMPNCGNFREVANESWPGQNQTAAAKEMYKSWRQSHGHWSVVNGRCSYWGYAMVLGGNGTWYACGICCDTK